MGSVFRMRFPAPAAPAVERVELRTLLAIPALGQTELFADEGLGTPGLAGTYFDESLRADATPSDWRTTYDPSGARVDRTVSFTSRGWGDRAAVGLTGGTDADWDHFSAQWDGYLRVRTGHVNVRTRSDPGSRLYVDVNGDGQFDTSPGGGEFVDNGFGADRPSAVDGAPAGPLPPGVYRLRLQFEAGAGDNVMQLRTEAAPTVRVAYVIPSNREPQPDGVANLQNALPVMQEWYREAFARRGMEPRTFLYETEADGVTPKVHILNVTETDSYLRGDIWGRVNTAAGSAGVTLFAANQVWLFVPEIHTMAADGDITGGVALGASNGSGSDGGIAMIGSDMLPSFRPGRLADDRAYAGTVDPALGPYPLVQDVSFPWFEGSTFSSVASAHYGAAVHEMTHAFGMPHDFRNDSNADGNLMGNGFRGFRGIAYPTRYANEGVYVQSGQAEVLHNSRYFTHLSSAPDNTGPSLTITSGGVVGGVLRINVTASDPSGLRAAILQAGGNSVGDAVLTGTSVTTAMETTYYTPGQSTEVAVMAYDAWGNRTRRTLTLTPPATPARGPQPKIDVPRQTTRVGQSLRLDASGSTGLVAGTTVEWDLDGNGTFDTPPTTTRFFNATFPAPGVRMVRARLTPPSGTAVVSAPIPIRVLAATAQAGSVAGVVFQDLDGDGRRTPGDGGAAGVSVFADLDNDAVRDAAEPTAVSADDGSYTISGLAAGLFTVRVDPPADTVVSSPVGASHALPVVVYEGRVSGGREFGLRETVAPHVLSATFLAADGPHRIELEFDDDVSRSLGAGDVSVRDLGSGLEVATGDMALALSDGGKRATITFPGQPGDRLPAGTWRVALDPAGVTDRAGNRLADAAPVEFNVYSDVTGRHVFYNNSALDGRDPEANGGDDAAIDSDKQALLPPAPGSPSAPTFANITSYDRGINGVILDLAGLPLQRELSADDFVVNVSGGGNPGVWQDGPAPSQVALRRRDGVGTSDRVTLLWSDNAIRNGWLQVTVRATANTGLSAPDVFVFGNLVGETGDAATPRRVSALDVVAVRRAVGAAPGTGADRYDFNRDGVVDALDLAIVRRNLLDDLPAPPTA